MLADGNCLLHAVSMFMSGYPDDNMYLRKLLHFNMSQYGCQTELRQRWQKQREWQNTFVPDGGLHYTDEVSLTVSGVLSISCNFYLFLKMVVIDFHCQLSFFSGGCGEQLWFGNGNDQFSNLCNVFVST